MMIYGGGGDDDDDIGVMQPGFKLEHHSDAEFRFMPHTVIPSD